MTKEKNSTILSKIFSSKDRRFDTVFFMAVIILTVYGTLMVYSAGYAYADFR